MRGAGQRRKAEHNGRAWQAWITAHLPGNDKVRLSDLTFNDRRPAKARSWEDEFAAFGAWAKARAH